jgi:hypothetical protein
VRVRSVTFAKPYSALSPLIFEARPARSYSTGLPLSFVMRPHVSPSQRGVSDSAMPFLIAVWSSV